MFVYLKLQVIRITLYTYRVDFSMVIIYIFHSFFSLYLSSFPILLFKFSFQAFALLRLATVVVVAFFA